MGRRSPLLVGVGEAVVSGSNRWLHFDAIIHSSSLPSNSLGQYRTITAGKNVPTTYSRQAFISFTPAPIFTLLFA